MLREHGVRCRSALTLAAANFAAAVAIGGCSGAQRAIQAYTGQENPRLCYRVEGKDAGLVTALERSLGNLSTASRTVTGCHDAHCMTTSDATQGCDLSVFVEVTDYAFTVSPPRHREADCSGAPAVEELVDYAASARAQFSFFDHTARSTVASGPVDARWSGEQTIGWWLITKYGTKGDQRGWGPGNSERTMQERLDRYLAFRLVDEITGSLPKKSSST